MANLFGEMAQGTWSRYNEGNRWVLPRMNRRGEFVVNDFINQAAIDGRIFCANGGTATAPLTFGAGSIDTTEPDLMIACPADTTIVPIEIRVKIEAYGTNAIFELMAACGTGGAVGTDTDLAAGTTICNLRTDAPNTSLASIGVASNADATYMTTNVCEFWRDGLMKAITTGTADDDSPMPPQTFVWQRNVTGTGPVLKDASQLAVFAAAQASTGFITVIYAEAPTNMWFET